MYLGNNKLDGLELVKSLIHWHDEVITSLLSRIVHLDLAFFFYLEFHDSFIVIFLRLMIINSYYFLTGQPWSQVWSTCPRGEDFCWRGTEEYDWSYSWQVRIYLDFIEKHNWSHLIQIETLTRKWCLILSFQRRQEQGWLYRLPRIHCCSAGCLRCKWKIGSPTWTQDT